MRHGIRLQWPTLRLAALLSLMSGCALPPSVPLGTPAPEVLRQLGAPTARHRLADGQSRWEYATGPAGSETHMLDFGPDERLQRKQQVLTEPSFATVRVGDAAESVRQSLGRPSQVGSAGLRGGQLWSWRYHSPFCQWFQVVIGDDQRVRETGYGVDPQCAVDQ